MNADGMRPPTEVKTPAMSASAVSVRSAKTVLQKNFLFRGLPDSSLERIAALATRRSYPKGAVIFSQGEPGDALFGVIAGQVRISASGAAAQEVFLNIMEPGDTFGEVAVMDGLPRTAGAYALERRLVDHDQALGLPEAARARAAARDPAAQAPVRAFALDERARRGDRVSRKPRSSRQAPIDSRVAARPVDERRRARAPNLSVGSRALPEHLAPDRQSEPEQVAKQRLGAASGIPES